MIASSVGANDPALPTFYQQDKNTIKAHTYALLFVGQIPIKHNISGCCQHVKTFKWYEYFCTALSLADWSAAENTVFLVFKNDEKKKSMQSL